MKDDDFIRVIDSSHVIEIISERFDNALELMGRNSLAYGGAIRDILADLPVDGDLDIVVNNYAYQEVVAQFQSSAKWTRVNAQGVAQVPILKPTNPKKGSAEMSYKPTFSSTSRLVTRNPYGTSVPMVETVSFETFDQARVQLVRARTNPEKDHTDPLFMPLDLARGADIRCCSLAVNGIGKIFELVDGALIDCKDRVLRTNKIKDPDRFNNLEERIEKLKARGWRSKINLPRTKEILKKVREKQKKEIAAKEVRHTPENHWEELGFIVKADVRKGDYQLDVDNHISNIIGKDIRNVIFDFCKKNKGCGLSEAAPSYPGFYSYRATSIGTIKALAGHVNSMKKMKSFSEILRGGPVKSSKSYAEYKKRYLDDAPEVASNSVVESVEPPEPISAEYAPPEPTSVKYTPPEHGVYMSTDEYFSASPDMVEFGAEITNSDETVITHGAVMPKKKPVQKDHWKTKIVAINSPNKRGRRG